MADLPAQPNLRVTSESLPAVATTSYPFAY